MEDEENMQDRWAALLANTIKNPNNENICFINILKQLNSQEVVILDKLFFGNARGRSEDRLANDRPLEINYIKSTFSLNTIDIDLIFDHLFRLNLCKLCNISTGASIWWDGSKGLVLTTLGYAFIEACQTGLHS